jgi:DNA polymerase III epsilon subunit-like protein
MYLIFDTETTGLPKNWSAPASDIHNWPRCIQIAWQLHDKMGNLIENYDYLIKPQGFIIPKDAEEIHGISTELANKNGTELEVVLSKFFEALMGAHFIVGHNLKFDINIIESEFYRLGYNSLPRFLTNYSPSSKFALDTCTEKTASLLKLPGGPGGRFKFPTLSELYKNLFDLPLQEVHNASADVEATSRCFFELIRKGIFTEEEEFEEGLGWGHEEYFELFKLSNPEKIPLIGIEHIDLNKASKEIVVDSKQKSYNSEKWGFVDYTKFNDLKQKAKSSEMLSSGKLLLTGFKIVIDHENKEHVMMQLLQYRILNTIASNRKQHLSDSYNLISYSNTLKPLNVWVKITSENFKEVFRDLNGQLNIDEVFIKLKERGQNFQGILACFCEVKTIYVDGIEKIPILNITQISNKNELPQYILNANKRLKNNIYKTLNKNGLINSDEYYANYPYIYYCCEIFSPENIFDNLDLLTIKQTIMYSDSINPLKYEKHTFAIDDNNSQNPVFELISLNYGKHKDIIIENRYYNDDEEDGSF